MTKGGQNEEQAGSGASAPSFRGRGVRACRRCRLGDRGIDNIERDNSRLREQVDRCIEAGG
jgi:hypothetical protein